MCVEMNWRQNDSNFGWCFCCFLLVMVAVVLFSFWIQEQTTKQKEKKIGVKTIILFWLCDTSLFIFTVWHRNVFSSSLYLVPFFCWNVKKNLDVKMTNKRGRTNEYSVFHWFCVYLRDLFRSPLPVPLSFPLCVCIHVSITCISIRMHWATITSSHYIYLRVYYRT